MNETETRATYIDPALKAAGWGVIEGSKIKYEFPINKGRLIGNGQRNKPDKADYVLQYKGRNMAVIEAKAREKYYTEGVGQAKAYAEKLQVRFTYSTNGLKIYGIDREQGTEGDVEFFPTPDELWALCFPEPKQGEIVKSSDYWKIKLLSVPFEDRGGLWQPRYYQDNAITKVLESVADSKTRILLTLATGTGKTAIAFQIAWKLFEAKWTPQRDAARSPRILFLADRNILADQAFNAFSAFEETALVRISPEEIKKKGKVPKNGSIFFTIFQTFMSGGSASSPTFDVNNFPEIELPVDTKGAFMYILHCSDNSFYVGSTKNLSIRLEQHQSGNGAEHTKRRLPVKLVYYEKFERIDIAFDREKQVQKWSRAKKEALINQDIELLKKLSKSTHTENVNEQKTVGEPVEPYFGEYPKDFFDFIIIDECHRGGANDESSWRDIMDYFSPAVQLGLTATPKREINADTYNYFGDPVYIYSLKEGINDGFLTPFKVKEINTTIDDYVFTSDDTVLEGQIKEGKRYTEEEINRVIEIKEREEYRVKIFMDLINQNEKSLVFCATQAHALAIRDLINQARSRSLSNINSTRLLSGVEVNYCHRVTADDGKIGEQHLRDFQDNEKSIPTILTTSQKLSTGVDAPEIKNIILFRPINSIIEFKQIVGRGTRLFENKDYFTIYDFVNAHHHFSDAEWDGEPEDPEPLGGVPPKPRPEPPIEPPTSGGSEEIPCELCGYVVCRCEDKPKKIIKVKLADGKIRELQHMIKTSFWSPEGKPISADSFLQTLFGALPELFKDENELIDIWSKPDTRKKLLEELSEKGFSKAQLTELQKVLSAENSDLYDVLAYVAFHSEIIDRSFRAEKAKVNLKDYNPKQQEFLNFVLSQYVKQGVDELDDSKIGDLLVLKYNAIADAKRELGDIPSIRKSFIDFQTYLYDDRVAI